MRAARLVGTAGGRPGGRRPAARGLLGRQLGHYAAGAAGQLLVVWAASWHMVVLPAVSLYDNFGSVQALQEFRAMLERRVDFGRFAVQTDGSGPCF